MTTSFLISITDESLNEAHLGDKEILDMTLETLSKLYTKYSLKFKCGFNPALVSHGGIC